MRFSTIPAVVAAAIFLVSAGRVGQDPARMKGAFRKPAENGWTYVHLEGSPSEIGYQHGVLLAPEIEDARKVIALELQHDDHKDWNFFRNAARTILWPHIERE
jgi:hypothetical protein